MVIAAVILAAGNGARLGGVAKALIRVAGEPLVLRQLRALRASGIDRVHVVTGQYHDAIAVALASHGAGLVRNRDPGGGQPGSVRLGLQSIDPAAEAVVIVPCDLALLTGDDLNELVAAFRQRAGGEFVVPRCGGRRGNPVIASRAAVRTILESSRYVACRDYMDAHPESVSYRETANDHCVVDIDTLQDLVSVATRLQCAVTLPGDRQAA